MRCIAANRSILTTIDQNITFIDDDNRSHCTAMTNEIDSTDIIQFADGWYSYPELDTFDSDLLLDALTLRNIKSTKVISLWNIKAENPTTLPLNEIATRQLEALFNLSQLLFGLARQEQSNYTFRDLQLGHPPRSFQQSGFNKFSKNNNNNQSLFELVVHDIMKSDCINIVLMMYKDPRIRCVKQKSLDFLTTISLIHENGYRILKSNKKFFIELIQGIRDGHLIEEKIPSLSLILHLSKIIIEKNLLEYYQYLIEMQFIDILIDILQNQEYKTIDLIIYFIKFELFTFQCFHIILQSIEYVQMWSEKAQIRLVNYCCTLMYKSVLNNNNNHHCEKLEINHIIYAEEHKIIHGLDYGILAFLNVIRCRKEIEKFYQDNEHFRELINLMKNKYQFSSYNSTISSAINQVIYIMFDRYKQKKRKEYQPILSNEIHDENRQYRKCSNSLCQIIENHQIQFENCPYCHKLFYCSQYCRDVHWTLSHNLSCRSINSDRKKEELTVLCMIDKFSKITSRHYQDNTTTLKSHNSVFETLPIQMTQTVIDATADIPNDLCYPSSSSSSLTGKKKSLKTLLSLLHVSRKQH